MLLKSSINKLFRFKITTQENKVRAVRQILIQFQLKILFIDSVMHLHEFLTAVRQILKRFHCSIFSIDSISFSAE